MTPLMRVMLAGALLVTGMASVKADDEMDKTTWKIFEVGKISSSDILTFENGRIHSSALAQKKFIINKFQTYQLGYKVSWIANLSNNKNETVFLSGDMQNHEMKGKRLITDSSGRTTQEYWTAKKISN